MVNQRSSVWEIIGAEFSKSIAHTADGISIRHPRVAKLYIGEAPLSFITNAFHRLRDDKEITDHTNLADLRKIVAASKNGLVEGDENEKEERNEEDIEEEDITGADSPYLSAS